MIGSVGEVAEQPAEVRRVAARLEAIGTDEIAGVLSSVPPQWPLDDRQLETIGFFLERRAPQVASRLRGLAGVRDEACLLDHSLRAEHG